jgi:hypothetical protein
MQKHHVCIMSLGDQILSSSVRSLRAAAIRSTSFTSDMATFVGQRYSGLTGLFSGVWPERQRVGEGHNFDCPPGKLPDGNDLTDTVSRKGHQLAAMPLSLHK